MKKLFTAVALAAAATFATAAPVEIIKVNPGEPGTLTLNGWEHSGAPSMTMTVDGIGSTSAGVGGLRSTFIANDPFGSLDVDFIAYCIELFTRATPFGTGGVMEKFAATSAAMSQLFAYSDFLNTPLSGVGGAATTDNNVRSAGLQLAIWELLYDETPGDAGAGTFRAAGGGTTGTNSIAWANSLLGGFSGYTELSSALTVYSDFELTNKGYQDFITATQTTGGGNEIPEPGSLALAGLGLLAAGTLRRKTAVKG